jgi:3,4-dihydroxy 2-butanone 4-phosphate synthase/GTP cyclohydrolase II
MDFEVMSADPDERVRIAIDDIKAGRMVILVDDEDRENEGDLTMAAEQVTPEAINFMATYGRGLICLSLTEERVASLNLPMMAPTNRSPFSTAFTVSIEAREGVTTGISAADRAHTIKVAIDPHCGPADLVTPGHIFPLRARKGGVLVRTGQTEGSVDLARMAGLTQAGVICEIMNDDGTMARLPDLKHFGERHQIHIVTVADLVRWRMRTERQVEMLFETQLSTESYGNYTARVFQAHNGSLHMALWKGELQVDQPVLVRVQTAAGPVDALQLHVPAPETSLHEALSALNRISSASSVLLYLHVEGSPVDRLLARFQAKRETAPESQSALRELGLGAQILRALGITRLKLLTNNPRKIVGLEGFGLEVVERVALSPSHP